VGNQKVNSFIDTEIWSFSQKTPEKDKFDSKEDFNKTLALHKNANTFLKKQIQENQILMTYHQLAEIFHVLGFRGKKMTLSWLQNFCSSLLSSRFIIWFEINENHLKKSLKMSIESSIHIWDFLCVVPLLDEVDILYSCDKHFLDPSIQSLGPEVVNPLNEWIVL